MAQSVTQLKCPNCQAPIQAALEQLIDVGQDPSAKSRLMSGNLNRVRCPVCQFEGQISSPLVYHDPNHELLLTYMPVEISIPKDEQERVIGQMINQVTNRLEPEQRKAYLFQPQAVLTLQGLLEKVLEADGISKEEIEAQRARMRLFEDLLKTPEEFLDAFIKDHDEDLDSAFFQLASLTLQATENQRAREAINARIERALLHSTFGKSIQTQEQELQAAAQSLNEIGEGITREHILDLLIEAPNDERVIALVNLTRPGLDYTFFQDLTERIEAAEGEDQEHLSNLRKRVLEITEEIDKAQEARATQAAALLRSILEAEDLDQAIQGALPLIDDLFLGILQANIQAAQEREDELTAERLVMISDRIQEIVSEALPAGIRLAQKVLDTEDEDAVRSLLEESSDQIDEQMLSALMSTAERLSERGDTETADRIRKMYKLALQISMQTQLQQPQADD
jgi:hypothetical protein